MSDSPKLLLGEPVAKAIHAQTKRRVAALKAAGVTPCLATVLVGENPASLAYIRMKQRSAERIGIGSKEVLLPESADSAALLAALGELNQDPSVHGILLQHPSPPHIDERAAFDAILPEKDVDGTSSASFGRTALGEAGFPSCTPQAIMSILIDAGYNKGNIGDVHYETCARNAAAITPVPGGIGPVTIATLLKQTVDAAEAAVQAAAQMAAQMAAQAPETRGIQSGSLPISAKRSR